MYDRIVNALEEFGLRLCADSVPVRDADDLAARIDIAARNFAAGRRKALRRSRSREYGLEGTPTLAPEPWYGPGR
ncbi:hypothetical protein FTUN_0604 [Frigoriglobus tundricola]|uniref:Uncharacterized protein n=1 Tax=Frigoriglobus tundricola TaxID=2774151 RepID=A0A6M5YIF9_9BACT|nr:hypothetical protein FTUN_0604 [Frigoriglobus tundricola]